MPATAPLATVPKPSVPQPSVAFFISEGSERCPFVFERFHHAVASSTHQLRLERLEASTTADIGQALDDVVGRAALLIIDVTPRLAGDEARWHPNTMYAVGRAHQAKIPVFLVCDHRFGPKTRQERLAWTIDVGAVHWYHFSPKGLDALIRDFTATMLTSRGAIRRGTLFPAAKAKRPNKRAPRRATDLSAQMTLGNHTIIGRVTSLSTSGAFFVPRALPGEPLDQPQPTRLSLVHGRTQEQHDVELRRVGPTNSPNVLGFGVRFVRPPSPRRGGSPTPGARG